MRPKLPTNKVRQSLSRQIDQGHILGVFDRLKQDVNTLSPELLECIPVKLVSCIEDFYRQIYASIIDNEDYKKNLVKVKRLKELKFDFEIINTLEDGEMSLGEYISYLFPCNNLNEILSNISELLGIDFAKEIKLLFKTKHDYDVFYVTIEDIFTLRHRICHEASSVSTLTKKDVSKMIDYTIQFLRSSELIVLRLLYPNSPMTTIEMRESAEKSYDEAEKELTDLIKRIKEGLSKTDFPETFNYIKKWKEYREERARENAGNFAEGGSMYPVLYLMDLEKITRQMIKEFRADYKWLLR